jgi:hypothetical protein
MRRLPYSSLGEAALMGFGRALSWDIGTLQAAAWSSSDSRKGCSSPSLKVL